MLRNQYYLNFIGREFHCFTYVTNTKTLWLLDESKNLVKVEVGYLANLLAKQEIDDSELVDALFKPSEYLVSPFNSTQKFLNNEYFLTQQQESVKNKILTSHNYQKVNKFISIKGSAGTGKTLLTYDIVKDFKNKNKKALIIHCGMLNNGHEKLIEKGWEIVPIKNYRTCVLEDYDLLVIDEAQRIYPSQLEVIKEKAQGLCIFSHDKLQTLSDGETDNKMCVKIDSIATITQYKLKEKIRTNKEVADFIKMLFNNKQEFSLSSNSNIEINYFNNTQDAKKYLNTLDKNKWEVLRLTPSTVNNEFHKSYSNPENKNSHGVIGQEFEGVAVTIDNHFSYGENGGLTYNSSTYYNPTKMLFQNITRSRKKLNVLIINNEELLSRCMRILSNPLVNAASQVV